MKWYKVDIREIDKTEYEIWFSKMSEEARQRVQKFKKEDDKKRTIAGEMLARKAIAEWCLVDDSEIVILRDEKGKPYAKNLDVHFNISHSENMVVCAIDNKPVGIDIEQIKPINLAIAKRICNNEELEYLFGYIPIDEDFKITDKREILLRFFELWTAKEAYAKYLGTGLISISLPMPKEIEKQIIDNQYFVSIYK